MVCVHLEEVIEPCRRFMSFECFMLKWQSNLICKHALTQVTEIRVFRETFQRSIQIQFQIATFHYLYQISSHLLRSQNCHNLELLFLSF